MICRLEALSDKIIVDEEVEEASVIILLYKSFRLLQNIYMYYMYFLKNTYVHTFSYRKWIPLEDFESQNKYAMLKPITAMLKGKFNICVQ